MSLVIVAFLVDLISHLNESIMHLQGENRSINAML